MDIEYNVVIVGLQRWVEVEKGVNGNGENIINQEKEKKWKWWKEVIGIWTYFEDTTKRISQYLSSVSLNQGPFTLQEAFNNIWKFFIVMTKGLL